MTFFPIESNNTPMNPVNPIAPPSFKTFINLKLDLREGRVTTPRPIMVPVSIAGPSGKTGIFFTRTSGNADGSLSVYGAFKDGASVNERVLIADNLSWTDQMQNVAEFLNPYRILILEYTFVGEEDTSVDVILSFF